MERQHETESKISFPIGKGLDRSLVVAHNKVWDPLETYSGQASANLCGVLFFLIEDWARTSGKR